MSATDFHKERIRRIASWSCLCMAVLYCPRHVHSQDATETCPHTLRVFQGNTLRATFETGNNYKDVPVMANRSVQFHLVAPEMVIAMTFQYTDADLQETKIGDSASWNFTMEAKYVLDDKDYSMDAVINYYDDNADCFDSTFSWSFTFIDAHKKASTPDPEKNTDLPPEKKNAGPTEAPPRDEGNFSLKYPLILIGLLVAALVAVLLAVYKNVISCGKKGKISKEKNDDEDANKEAGDKGENKNVGEGNNEENGGDANEENKATQADKESSVDKEK